MATRRLALGGHQPAFLVIFSPHIFTQVASGCSNDHVRPEGFQICECTSSCLLHSKSIMLTKPYFTLRTAALLTALTTPAIVISANRGRL